MDDVQDQAVGGEGAPESMPMAQKPDAPEVSDSRRALVKEIIDGVKRARQKHDSAFKRMRESMKLAANGTTDKATAEALDGAYVVPITNRHINQAVASLYAKNPKATAKRKPKMLYQLWDGSPETLALAQQAAMAPPAVMQDPVTGTAMPGPPDPMAMQAQAVLAEVEAARQEILLYDRMAKTMEILFGYYLDEQDAGYKEQFKALVRRAKVCGVGYVKLGFQRVLERRPDIDAQIADATMQITAIEAGLHEMAEGEIDEQSAKAEELRILIDDLQSKAEIVVREGPVLSFPRATEIIPDENCRHLKTFAGSRRVAQEFDLSTDQIKEIYGVDVCASYTAYSDAAKPEKGKLGRVWEVYDKRNNQVCVVCDGYPDFLKEPAEPDVKLERFWPIFPLVLNEVESDGEDISIFPPSDAWNARHMQREYNGNRQGLREHRIAARPRPIAPAGRIENKDIKSLASQAPHEILFLNGMTTGEKIDDIIQYMKVPGVDPNLYETETVFTDIQRTVGTQEANFGGTSGNTATESSIAEQSRMTSNGSDVDDLDNLLTALARAMGQLMLQELSKDTVIEIAGPGAVWPDAPPSREQIAKELVLGIKAGSSGRPNRAAELANFERAMPYVSLIPGIPPAPLAEKALDLMEIDVEEAYVEGMPSITAQNQMAGRNQQAGGGPNAPEQQGGQGADNAPGAEQRNEPQSQPAYPTGAPTH